MNQSLSSITLDFIQGGLEEAGSLLTRGWGSHRKAKLRIMGKWMMTAHGPGAAVIEAQSAGRCQRKTSLREGGVAPGKAPSQRRWHEGWS